MYDNFTLLKIGMVARREEEEGEAEEREEAITRKTRRKPLKAIKLKLGLHNKVWISSSMKPEFIKRSCKLTKSFSKTFGFSCVLCICYVSAIIRIQNRSSDTL